MYIYINIQKKNIYQLLCWWAFIHWKKSVKNSYFLNYSWKIIIINYWTKKPQLKWQILASLVFLVFFLKHLKISLVEVQTPYHYLIFAICYSPYTRILLRIISFENNYKYILIILTEIFSLRFFRKYINCLLLISIL